MKKFKLSKGTATKKELKVLREKLRTRIQINKLAQNMVHNFKLENEAVNDCHAPRRLSTAILIEILDRLFEIDKKLNPPKD